MKIFHTKDGKITKVPYTEHVPPDVTAQIYWLKNRRPDRWRDVQNIDHAVGVYHISEAPLSEEEWIEHTSNGTQLEPKAGARPRRSLCCPHSMKAIRQLLTGWSLVQIRPGEPSNFKDLAQISKTKFWAKKPPGPHREPQSAKLAGDSLVRPPAGPHFAAPFGPEVAPAAAGGAWRGIVAGMATGLARRSVRRVAADRGTLLGLIPPPLPVALDGRRQRSLLHHRAALNHHILRVPIAEVATPLGG